MVKLSTTTAACTAILAAAVLVAGVQTSTNSQTRLDARDEASGAAQESRMQDGQMRASEILGSAIYTARNTKIGKVRELIIDNDGHMAAVIVDVAFVGLGEKSVAVNLEDITSGDNHLILNRTVDELQQMASYKLESDNAPASPSSPNLGGQLTAAPVH